MDGSERALAPVARIVGLGAILLALPAVLVPLGLKAEADAVDYRVPMLQWMIRHHAIPAWSWTPVDNYPMLGELLMLPLRALRAGMDRCVPLAAYAGIGWCSGTLFRRLNPGFGAAGFWTAFAVTVCFRPLVIQSNLLMVDSLASFFVLAAVLFSLRRQYAWAGLVFGLGMATRYSVWPLLPALGFTYWLRWRNARESIWLAFCAFVPVVPHLARNIMLEGNPVFPLLGSVFGPADVVINVGWDLYGRSSSVVGLLLLPFDLLFTNEFVPHIFDYTLGFFTLFSLVVGLVCVVRQRRSAVDACSELCANQDARALGAFCLIGFVTWDITAAQLRFAVPELVIVLVLLLAVFVRVAGWRIMMIVLAVGMLSAAAVQADMLAIVIGRRQTAFHAAAERARLSLARADLSQDVAVGWSVRDGSLGFLDRDFVFVGTHPLALGKAREPDVGWVYDGKDLMKRAPKR